jgi:16S rRNA (cytosine1402-N4)-methyltransferase
LSSGKPPMSHVPVMVPEVVHYVVYEESRVVFDGTVGCGGHARAVLETNPRVQLIGVDTDPDALSVAGRLLAPYASRVRLVRASYTEAPRIAGETGPFDGVLLDLGVSSLQLDDSKRGFSYVKDGPLDMRMSGSGESAVEMIARTSENELTGILKRFGEVSGAWRIARSIKHAARNRRLVSTADLGHAVAEAVGGRPAPGLLSQVFQAIRIAVNGELDNIKSFLGSVLGCVNANARLVFVSYQSLEDRAIKEFLKKESVDCVCPPSVPVCNCGHRASLELLTRRAVKPTAAEITANSRARSARLRAARVLAGRSST